VSAIKIDSQTNVHSTAQTKPRESEAEREKRHKEKKKKKDKKREKSEHHSHHHSSSETSKSVENGVVEIASKKHKHKHKERSRDRDRESSKDVIGTTNSLPGIKLKIKTMPPSPALPPPLAPLKISLSHLSSDATSTSDLRKRLRPTSESSTEESSGMGPASKMSRVLGTTLEAESQFLRAVGSNGTCPNHLSSKSAPKKVKLKIRAY
jgi:hypothetical protein